MTQNFPIISAAAKAAYAKYDHNRETCGCGNENDAPLAEIINVYLAGFGGRQEVGENATDHDLVVARKHVKFGPNGCACGYGGVFEALLIAENLGALRSQGDFRRAEKIADIVVGEWNRLQAEKDLAYMAERALIEEHAKKFLSHGGINVRIGEGGQPVLLSSYTAAKWEVPTTWADRRPTLWAWVKIWFARKY